MLSRVASNLYWMGRYIERVEHLTRYNKEIYFSSLDAPIIGANDRKFVLESILYMNGIFDIADMSEKEVLFKISFDRENPEAIISLVTKARENARGARNTISTDLWEAINTLYHFVNNYSPETYTSSGLYEFSQKILEEISIVKGKIMGSLLHDEAWAIIMMGMNVERVIQVIRIINSKLNDIYKIESAGHEVTNLSFEWSNLLRCTESFDMNRSYYRAIPNRERVLEFLVLNEQCPRSINHTLQGISIYMKKIIDKKEANSSTIDFKISKLSAYFKYLSYDEFEDEVYKLLNATQNKIMEISAELEKKYFSQ